MKDAIQTHANLRAAEARVKQLEGYIANLVRIGLSADYNPTVRTMSSHDMYAWWANYMRRIDDNIRESARQVLRREDTSSE